MFRVPATHIIRSTQNCSCSLRYRSYLFRLATLEGGSCTKIWPVPEAVVTVLCTPDNGCGWNLKHVEWTCRIINKLLCISSRWTVINTGVFISPWNMLENWLMPQLNEDSNDYIFQQDGSPAHYKDVWGYLNRNLPQRWRGRTRKDEDALMRWPPRSPDLTPCDFFFWGFVKDTVFVPPLPGNLQIFATISPLLWLWWNVLCWHACGTRWTIA